MIKRFKNIPMAYLTAIVTILFFYLLIAIAPDWSHSIHETERDIHFSVRGDRDPSENIILIHIGRDDINALGGWPISRDYYGFLIYALNQMGCRIIGLDVMFNHTDQLHPEFDKTLAGFMSEYENICLPMTFSELKIGESGELEGINPNYPHDQFREPAAGLGFSNMGPELIIRSLPIVARFESELMLSFGAELARQYLKSEKDFYFDGKTVGLADSAGIWKSLALDEKGRIILNHFGSLDRLPSISLVNLLKIFNEKPDTLLVKDKLAIIAYTAPGITSLVSTPLNDLMPASVMHATLAENIVFDRLITETGLWIELALILILCSLSLILFRRYQLRSVAPVLITLSIGLWMIAHLLFTKAFLAIYIFYPIFAVLIHSVVQSILFVAERRKAQDSVQQLLNKQVEVKSRQLSEARTELQRLQNQLSNEEKISSESKQVTDQQKDIINKLEKELRDLTTQDLPKLSERKLPEFKDIVYSKDSKLENVLEEVSKVSSYDIPVLILGETGTGKEMIARAIHQLSQRKSMPFVAVNCGALSETLLDSELFGHEKGSFTGAVTRRKGRFELANGGTIFLDEITETSASFQAKLLRVLQEGTLERLGSEQTLKVDVRVVAATNRNLNAEQENGRFRTDLYYRLNGYPVNIPPLRERSSDIPELSSHILQKYDFSSIAGFSTGVMNALQKYAWPGNIRELENIIRRAAISAQGENRAEIREADLPDEIRNNSKNSGLESIHSPIEDQIISSLRTLRFSRASIKQTAEHLGNKDRGTITEYFRGLCFKNLVEADMDLHDTTRKIAGSDEEEIINRVHGKVQEYLNSLNKLCSDPSPNQEKTLYKGLPKKYHSYLEELINHIKSNGPLL